MHALTFAQVLLKIFKKWSVFFSLSPPSSSLILRLYMYTSWCRAIWYIFFLYFVILLFVEFGHWKMQRASVTRVTTVIFDYQQGKINEQTGKKIEFSINLIHSTVYGLQFCDLHQIVVFAIIVIFGLRLCALPHRQSVLICVLCTCTSVCGFKSLSKTVFLLCLLMKCVTPITFPLIWFKVHWKLNHALQNWVETIGWPGVQRLISILYIYVCMYST